MPKKEQSNENIFNSKEDIFNSKEELKDYIHDIHNFIRNNGAGYGKTGMKIFNIFYGLKLIEPHLDSLNLGMSNDDKENLKFSNLIKKAKKKDNLITEYIDKQILDVLINFENDLVVVRKLLFHEIPRDLTGEFWCKLINQINIIPVGYCKDNESKVNLSGKVYEYFIGRDKSAISELGAFFTDRYITEFLIDKVNPTVDENNDIPTIIDPFAGSGGFTLGVANYFREHFENIDWKDNVNNIFHFDMDEDVINMSGLEMFAITSNLPKIDDSNYKRVNSFAHEFDNIKYNYVFSNPPYGGDKIIETASQIKKKAIIQHIKSTIKTEHLKHNKQYIDLCEEVKQFKQNTERKVTLSSCSKRIKAFAKKYDLNSNDKEGCSLLLLMDLLSKDGTCCAVLKEGVFFDNSYADIRKVLIENFNITNIISIPSDAFESTTTKTSAIIFKNNGKTKEIKFSELLVEKAKSNTIEKDENQNYFIKYLKDEIIDVYENELLTVTFEELIVPTIIKKYDNEEKKYYDVERYDYSLNCKNYNKKEIVVGNGYELVKLGDKCNCLTTTKHCTNIAKSNGKFKFYNSSQNSDLYVDFCEVKDYSIILGQGGNFNIHFDKDFTPSKHVCVIQSSEKNIELLKYFYYIIPELQKYFITNCSTISWLNKTNIKDFNIPIPKSKEKITKWVNKISKPYDKKNENEKLIMKLEEEIQNKIKDIEDNEECDDIELNDILIKCSNGKTNTTTITNTGEYPFYSATAENPYGTHNTFDFDYKDYFVFSKSGGNSKTIYGDSLGIGKFWLVHGKSAISTNMSIFKINDKFNIIYIDYYLKYILYDIQKFALYTTGNGSIKVSDMLKTFKLKIPKNKQLIKDFDPLFQQIEKLQTELKEADTLYKKLIKELSEEAIPPNKQTDNDNDEKIEEEEEEVEVISKKKKKINETKNSEL